MKCLIFANGDYGDYSFCQSIGHYDYIICADNGMKHARILGVMPQLIVGDFDSSQEQDLQYFKSQHVNIEHFSAIKDQTDTEIALDKAIQKGASSIDIYGGAGSRLDHTLANVHLLYKALQKKVTATLISSSNKVYLINHSIQIKGKPGDFVSLLPFSEEVTGVYTQALGYALKDDKLVWGNSYGVSNYMLEDRASVSIKKGLLLVIQARD